MSTKQKQTPKWKKLILKKTKDLNFGQNLHTHLKINTEKTKKKRNKLGDYLLHWILEIVFLFV